MFHDISLHLLDLAVNSVKAGADTVELALTLARKILYISVTDNGRGISRQLRETLEYGSCPGDNSPSGRGVMLFRDASRRTGGVFHVRSEPNCCTCVSASFCTDSPFFPLLGDLGETAALLVTGNKGLRVKFFVKNQISERDDISYGFDSDLLQGGVRFHAIGKYYWIREEINKGVMNIFGGVPCEIFGRTENNQRENKE